MKMVNSVITKSAFQTKKFGKALAENLRGRVLALEGELGSGKTTFLQGFAKGLGIKAKILSPTFTIIKKFQIPKNKAKHLKFKTFYHIDCYRIKCPNDILDLGFKEIVFNSKNVVAVEWADKVKKILPKNIIWLKFELINEKARKITLRR